MSFITTYTKKYFDPLNVDERHERFLQAAGYSA